MFWDKTLEVKKSKYNGEIVIKKTFGLGTYIQVGGITQSGKIIENIWEPVFKKLKDKKNIKFKNILILGLGGGSVTKVIRKYFPKAKITGVEIDPEMVKMGFKHLGLGKGNINIVIQDAKVFISKLKFENFDLIIVDTYLGRDYVNITGFHPAGSKIVVINRLKPDPGLEKKLKSAFSSVEVIKPLVNTVYICSGKRD